MTPERWKKIEEIFQDALDLPGAERRNFIAGQTAGDDELRAEVEKLVARYEKEEGFLESPVWTDSRFLGETLRVDLIDTLDGKTLVGEKVGVYRITGEIGRGGMGVVYAAERDDGEFRRRVAVKLIKRGMDTDFIVRRFRRERQILANFNHPNIARLLDGGTTEDGAPYFVMEYIEGEPLLEYSARRDPDLPARLELFLRVCDAISYAHGRKIIHRDIKPSNILVTRDAVPKLLDFGIAKILDADAIHESQLPTATAVRLLTPEYASPEQIRGETTAPAGDQYSLGVLLYELLTGSRPYKFPSRAPHEIARVICEARPAPLVVQTSQTEAKADELNKIVLKTLRKDPAERYASVDDLAADIRRFLRRETVRAESFAVSESGKSGIGEREMTIAVLPFKILNTNASDETGETAFLGVGLADALITRLSNMRQLIVRPTSSILRYGAGETDSLRAGAELGVAYILDGTIIKAESRYRVSIQLIDVARQSAVLAERFLESFEDVLQLEDKISLRVTESLLPRLTGEQRRRLEKRGTDNADAYEAYLRGRFHWNSFTEDGFAKAFAAYQHAIAIDPQYALAYAGIADYYIWLGVYGVVAPQDCYPRAKDAARRAIAIDAELAEAYTALGFAELCGDLDWQNADLNLRRAIAVNPHYALARLWYSYYLQTTARFDEGIAEAREAVKLDPLNYSSRHVLAWAYYFARRYADAAREIESTIEKFPMVGLGYISLSWFLRRDGRAEKSLEASRRSLELAGKTNFVLLCHAQALAAAGKAEETEAVLREVLKQGARQYVSYYQVALAYLNAGEKEKAMDALERAFEDREGWLIWLKTEPALDALRDGERFAKLVENVENLQSAESAAIPLDEPQTEAAAAGNRGEMSETRRLTAPLKYFLIAALLIILGLFFYNIAARGLVSF